MKRKTSTLSIAISCMLLAPFAHAAEVKLLSAVGMKEVMEDLWPKFERASGHKLTIVLATSARLCAGFKMANSPISSSSPDRASMDS